MKINWKVRFRNPMFWASVMPAVTACVYTVLGAFGIVPALTENMVLNILSAVLTALTTLGVLIDPTTAGFSDSALAMTYEKPRNDDLFEEELGK